jgi:ketosteroid isomerase-like protein
VVSVPDQLSVLEDKQAITDVVHRYGYALDGRNWELLATCFTPDAIGYYGGDPLQGYAAIETLCRNTLEPMSVSQHLIGNVFVTVDGDEASAQCYLHAQHVLPDTPGGDQFIFAGRYTDKLVRSPDGWRISERTLEPMWTSGNIAVLGRPSNTLELPEE